MQTMDEKDNTARHNVTVRLTDSEYQQLNELLEGEKRRTRRGIRITRADILRAGLGMLYDDRNRDRRKKTEE